MVTNLTESSSDFSIVSSLDALSITSSARPNQTGDEAPSHQGDSDGVVRPHALAVPPTRFLRHRSVARAQHQREEGDSSLSTSMSVMNRTSTSDSSSLPTTPSDLSSSSSPDSVVVLEVHRTDSDTATDEYSVESLDEVPELDESAALRLSRVPRVRGPSSVLSSDEAQSTIDSFLTSRSTFVRNKENKLRLWQSLCIEFGLVDSNSEDTLPPTACKTPRDTKKKTTLPPLPTTLTQANALLKQKAHVNINDYLSARKVPLGEGERRDFSHLLHPTSNAMIKHTIRTGKYTPKKYAKDE